MRGAIVGFNFYKLVLMFIAIVIQNTIVLRPSMVFEKSLVEADMICYFL